MESFGHVKIVEFFRPVEAVFLYVASNSIIDTFILKPHDKSGDRVLFRQPDGLENDTEQRQSNATAGTCTKSARCCVKSAVPFPLCV